MSNQIREIAAARGVSVVSVWELYRADLEQQAAEAQAAGLNVLARQLRQQLEATTTEYRKALAAETR